MSKMDFRLTFLNFGKLSNSTSGRSGICAASMWIGTKAASEHPERVPVSLGGKKPSWLYIATKYCVVQEPQQVC